MSDHRLMPVEPDVGMVGAGARVLRQLPGAEKLAKQVYRSMCAAAPVVHGEPVYLYRRLGLHDFVTCNHDRYAELSVKPHLFETKVLYTAPQPAEQQPAPDAVEIGPNDLIVQLWSSRTRSQWDYSWDRGVKITHVPSGITVTCETEGSVYANKEKALRVLEARLKGWSSPDVAQLVEALERIAAWPDGGNQCGQANIKIFAAEALSPYRKGGQV